MTRPLDRRFFWLVALVVVALSGWWTADRFARSPATPDPPVTPDPHGPAGLAQLPARPDDLAAQKIEALTPDQARARNEAVPLVVSARETPRGFRFSGSAQDRDRATECLALAGMAEAGGSDAGQRAVMQVVLNRVRHPAFVPTVCGVVFQGAERSTGCQFTFTCDGSLARTYSPAAWTASRSRARDALGGRVFAAVGTATHYHTDWVYPVWSGDLTKIARVETHLFFRWPGYWGSRAALRVAYRGGEPDWRSPLEDSVPTGEASVGIDAEQTPLDKLDVDAQAAGKVVARHPEGSAFLVQLSPGVTAAQATALGRQLCGTHGYCQVWGWSGSIAPRDFPLTPESRARLAFSYVIDATYREIVYFDCKRFPGVARDSCLPSLARNGPQTSSPVR